MRATLLLNPRSGTLLGQPALAGRIAAALRQAGFTLDIVPEDAAPDLAGRLDAALAGGAPVLIVGGGDGTLRSAAARLAGTGVALGVLPLGTMNLLARDLGLPLAPEAAALALGQAEIRAIDLAEVNGEPFLCQSVIGLPNRIGQHRERLRGDLRLAARWRLGIAALRLFWRHPPLRLALRLEEGPRLRRVWTRALSVVNNAYEEAPGRLFHRPVLDGGTLTLHVARGFGLGWILRMLLAMAAGQWRRSDALLSWRAATLSIHSRNRHLRVMNDGEALLLATPLQYRIHPGALRVLAPRREAAPDLARPPVPEELPA
ncbi:diacylglycerol kinase family protein [Pseudoroseomonas cervicalis]|uniref:diacylglycerol/lipid kinase family protein n=1 Tax=Teichococcus cervicalis TaxID=204525 RepID=UPI0022F19011|nr:diacylglycerol kinase family protein [Pseudoroseomonas cervicalis]WBV44105.1 diacylglycerol kinase family protein [Pseudoroseomonas cervicalis]